MEKIGNLQKALIKNTWYDCYNWLINSIPDPIKNCGFG